MVSEPTQIPNSHERPVINVQGERVALGPWRRDLVETYFRWENDFDLRRTDDPSEARPMTLEEVISDYDEWVKSGASQRVQFTIYEVEGWTPIGRANLRSFNWHNRTAEFGITIAEAHYRGRGFGTEAIKLVLDQAFTVMGVHNVLLDALETNPGGLRAYYKAGFREIGRWREASFLNGRYYDIVFMDCLARDFESPVLARVFAPEPLRG